MKKISITISGHRTSLTLEREFIDALCELARRRKKSVAALVQEIDDERNNQPAPNNLSSAVRVFVLKSKI